jgi:hypothetical protein
MWSDLKNDEKKPPIWINKGKRKITKKRAFARKQEKTKENRRFG